MSNQDLVNKFFECYLKKDFNSLKQVVAEDVVWYFRGKHKLAGTKRGLQELISFFDTMGGIMSKSKPAIEKLITAEQGKFFIECQHIKTNRDDGINVEHNVTVLWTIHEGKIVSGEHYFADPEAVNNYFNAVPL